MEIDIKLVEHARDYIEDLAKGINPLTKEAVDDNDIINQVKISRCLFYVADVLGAVAENGGITGKKAPKPKQEDFDIQKLDLTQFGYSAQPIGISVIAQKINALKPENMKKLKITALTNWLVDIHMLSIVQVNGKNHKRPTVNAESIGITMEERDGQYGPYYAVLYNEAAQHFIIDNLHAVIEGGYNGGRKKEE